VVQQHRASPQPYRKHYLNKIDIKRANNLYSMY
jgi:hypothetical protein